jgi:hypothetical protein
MSIVSVIIGVQTTVGIFLYILGNAGCGIGLALTWGYYGTVLAYLQWIRIWAGCP